MSDDVTLLPCPSCGWRGPSYQHIRDGCSLECRNRDCGLSVRAFNPNAAAKCAANWNTRTPSPDSGERMREADYVAGPVHRLAEEEDEVWSAEVQVTGGHYLAAEVYGATEAEARRHQSAVLAALQESAR